MFDRTTLTLHSQMGRILAAIVDPEQLQTEGMSLVFGLKLCDCFIIREQFSLQIARYGVYNSEAVSLCTEQKVYSLVMSLFIL